MIDTDKYEGHTPAPWKLTHIKPNGVVDENFEISFIHTIRGEEIKIADVHWTPDQADRWEFENWKANAQLIADTPLLLEEVKRLRPYEKFADGVNEWSGGAAFIHHLATTVQGIRLTGVLDEDAFNKGCQEYYNGENSIAQVSKIQWNNLEEEVKRLRKQIVDMIDSMDNHYIRDIQHATDCLRDMIGYYEDEEE